MTVSKDLAAQVDELQKQRKVTYRFQPPTVGAGTYRKNRSYYDGITRALKEAEASQGGTKVVSNVLLISGCMVEKRRILYLKGKAPFAFKTVTDLGSREILNLVAALLVCRGVIGWQSTV